MNAIFYLILTSVTSLHGFGLHDFGKSYNDHSTKAVSRETILKGSSTEQKWIEQPLDHFDANEKRKWNMSYYQNLQYWQPGGPIYLFTWGDDHPGIWVVENGLMSDLAKETNGAMFGTGNRYYQDNVPIDRSITKNLKYLTTRQALGDISHLLQSLKSSSNFTKSKVALFGTRYGGNMAAWMRLLYPNLVQGAIASSAPLLAKKDFYEYLEKVSDDYKTVGLKGCYEKIQGIFKRYDNLLKSAAGIKQLMDEENICDDIDMSKNENKQMFFSLETFEYTYSAEVDAIEQSCEDLMKTSPSLLKSYKFAQGLWREDPGCYDCSFQGYVKRAKHNDDLRMWLYQQCTEVGYFQTTDSKNQNMFTNNISADMFYKVCSALFGPDFNEKRVDEGVENTNKFYGGNTPNVTRVVFVNGDLDPWSPLGVLKNISSDAPAIVIPMVGNGMDLKPGTDEDSYQLKEARKQEKNLIKKWLNLDN